MEHIPVGSLYSTWMAFFGCRDGSNNTNAFYVTSGGSGYVSAFVGTYHFNNSNISYTFDTSGVTETIILSATEFTILRDGSQQFSYSNGNTVSLSSAKSIFIFGRNAGTGTLTYGGAVKLTSFKIYENDVLVRNFVPAVTQNGIGGLLETIDSIFYMNSGTGSFVVPSS
ncbi:MAG TPA: hypothetical protein PLT65_05420 [Bacilli bacterium]|nr:hypothetical protein [Bacilli bacterium]